MEDSSTTKQGVDQQAPDLEVSLSYRDSEKSENQQHHGDQSQADRQAKNSISILAKQENTALTTEPRQRPAKLNMKTG